MTISTISPLARLRRRAALTQAELAEQVGTTQQRVAAWERGANMPQARHARKLAEVLHIEIGELMLVLEESATNVRDNAYFAQSSPPRAA